MIKVEMCRDCGSPVIGMAVTNLEVRVEARGVDAQEAAAAFLSGSQLWTVRNLGQPGGMLSPAGAEVLSSLAGPTPPAVHVEHQCTRAIKGSWSASQPVVGPGGPTAPPKGPVAPWTASSGPLTSSPTVADAETPPSEAPACLLCPPLRADGTHADADLGDLLSWAAHTETCPGDGLA